MTIRIATVADLEAIRSIQASAPGASAWEPADYLNYDCQVALIDGRVVGFLVARPIADGEREILNVAVAVEDRRHGIGRALVAAELEKGGGSRFLEVRESNLAAVNLYTSMGFLPTGRRKDYYRGAVGMPDETAIVMSFLS